MARRVLITGRGTVNALGGDVAHTLAALAAGRSAIGPVTCREVERLRIRVAAAVSVPDLEAVFPPEMRQMHDRVSLLALLAAREAVAEAGLEAAELSSERTGVVLGTAGGGLETWNDAFRAVYAEGRNRVPPLTVPRLMPNAPASAVAADLGIVGPVLCPSAACASAAQALALGLHFIRSGLCDVVIAGGSEAMLTFAGIKAWEGLRVLSPDGCRPFAADRNGFVLGEGAAVLVLEGEDHARARGARAAVELAGAALRGQGGGDPVRPSAAAAGAVMRAALADAGIDPAGVDHVNAHATGTRQGDAAEAEALARLFGPRIGKLPVAATKGLHGHAIGASAAIEALACLLALEEGVIPPAGSHGVDPALGLDLVTGKARKAEVATCLSSTFAFGGLNAALVFRRVG